MACLVDNCVKLNELQLRVHTNNSSTHQAQLKVLVLKKYTVNASFLPGAAVAAAAVGGGADPESRLSGKVEEPRD